MTRPRLLLIAALLLALVLGFGLARFTTPAPADEPVEITESAEKGEASEGEGGEEGEAAEGFVALTPDQARAAGITIVNVTRGGGTETRLSGRVESTPDANAAVGAVMSGRIQRLLVAPGSRVETGTPIAVILSGDGAALHAGVSAADAQARAASQALRRETRLMEQGVVARQDVEASQARATAAQAEARAARARLAAAGNPTTSGLITVAAPIAGVVTGLQVGPGGFVTQGAVIATIANPNRVELVFNAPPALAASVRAGAVMTVQSEGSSFPAVVTAIAADADAQSGAALIRARADSMLPPAGSAVTATIVTGASGALTVPSAAIQTVEGRTVVFVAVEGGFGAVPIVPGRQAGDRTEVLRGLTGSERIASANAFLLKAELAKGEAEDED